MVYSPKIHLYYRLPLYHITFQLWSTNINAKNSKMPFGEMNLTSFAKLS